MATKAPPKPAAKPKSKPKTKPASQPDATPSPAPAAAPAAPAAKPTAKPKGPPRGAPKVAVPSPGSLPIRQERLARDGKKKRSTSHTEVNPLREGLRLERVPDPHVMVLFGATGD